MVKASFSKSVCCPDLHAGSSQMARLWFGMVQTDSSIVMANQERVLIIEVVFDRVA